MISFPRPYEKEGAPSCGIYLTAPKKLSFNQMVVQLRNAINAINSSKYQKNMHAVEFVFPKKIYEKEREQAGILVGMCRGAGMVSIIRGDIGLCVECGADGVIMEEPEQLQTARKALGNSAIIGLDCGNSRNKAEQALLNGVDYVTFSKFFATENSKKFADIELLEWWAKTTHLPAATFGNLDVNRIIKLTKAGAGFIGVGDWVWNHDDGPKQAIYLLQAAIEHGLAAEKIN